MKMFDRSVVDNLLLMFLLIPLMFIVFWGFLSLINKRAGFRLKPVLERIYENPIASAIYRSAVVIAVAQLVIAAFGRWV